MSRKINVLVFPAGEINAIELHDALSSCVNIKLYGASSVDRHGGFVFESNISGLPLISDGGFIDSFNSIIAEKQIDVIFPTHDDVAEFLTMNREKLQAAVIAADEETAVICRDKRKIYEIFSDCDFCPKVYSEVGEFPVFLKPRRGQGGVGSRIIKKFSDLPVGTDDYVICEYLADVEFTVDCFTDKDGILQAILPRSRQRVFGGVSVRGQNEQLTEEIEHIAMTINKRLKFLGLWFFQIKRDGKGRFKLLEISTRVAGTMCLSRVQGVNLPLLSVYAAMGYKTEILKNNYSVTVDRTLISRYKTDLQYECVYIDLDDTIIVDGKVNLQAVQFLFQCVNKGKRVFLLTRHNADHADSVEDTLKRHRISVELFDDIIHIDAETPKATAINPKSAIFIDNAFAERKAAYELLNIAVFDVDGIEVLLDWRR